MYNITFQQLETFLAVAERLNLSETANALYISQPALSKMIRRLEEGVGMTLFDRSNRGVTLTQEGEYLYERLRAPYRTICRTIDDARDLYEKPKRTIRIGYPSTYDSSEDYDRLKQIIAGYTEAHPEIDFIETLYDFAELRSALSYGDVDVAFSHNFILDDLENVSCKRVCWSRMCVAMSAQHPLAKYDTLQIDRLSKETFLAITFKGEQENIAMNERNLSHYGIKPGDIKLAPNFQSLLRMVRQGKGMALCGFFPKAPGHDEIKYFSLPDRPDAPYLAVAWRTGELSEDARRFVDAIPEAPSRE